MIRLTRCIGAKLALLWMGSIGLIQSTSLANEQPDIVVYLSDDHSQFDSSLYGNANIPAPQFERLASDGMTFTHAFVASPSCAPSRAAMLTGLMPARNGAEANHTYPKPGTQSLVRNLQTAGYEVVAFGKVAHGRTNQVKRYGFDHIGKGRTIKQVRAEVDAFLAGRESEKPLCLVVGTTNPHVSWTSPTTFDPAAVEFPPHHLDTPSTREHRAAYYQEIKELDAFLGELRTMAADKLGDNLLFIHSSDHGSQWPFGKWNLYDYGVRVPFIAAWSGKIPSGVSTDAMISWVDLLPTLIEVGGGEVPGDLDGRSFANVLLGKVDEHRDVIFTTHTGDGVKNIFPIRSIRDRDWKLIHNLHPEFAHTNHSDLDRKPMAGAYWTEWAELSKTDERAKQIVDRYYRRSEWELYNVSKDKWEQTNLIDRPEEAQRVADLKQRLATWMKSQSDQQLVHSEPRRLSDRQRWHPDSYKPATENTKKESRTKVKRPNGEVATESELAANHRRPNVLLIITDDQNDYYSAASGVDVKTPSIDRLKQQAIHFPRAYCASPVCGPSRAALFSGLHPHHTGVYLNGADPWRKSPQLQTVETLPELFRRGGYETWGMGKLFHAKLPASREPHQWDNRASANGGFGPFANPEHQLSGKFFSVQEWDGPDSDFPDVKSANAAVDFLRYRTSQTPFLMVYGLWRPHNPWTAPRRFFDLYDSHRINFPPPGYSESDLDDVPEEGKRLAAIYQQRWDKHGSANAEDWRRVVHGYLACTSFADWNIGRVINALDETEYAKNTIVILVSDNGYHVGEKSHYGKSTLWEDSARVPMLIRLPDHQNAATTSQATVGLIDLFPTLQKACALPNAKQKLDGRDMRTLWDNPKSNWRHAAITTYGQGRFSLRRGRWRYIRYSDGTEELYDHDVDPHELKNLAVDPETEKLRKTFREMVPNHWVPSIGGRNG